MRRQPRRDFLKTTAAAGVGYWVVGASQAADSKSPNERIRFACFGIAGKGGSDSNDAKSHGDVVAVCDIDNRALDQGRMRFPDAKQFTDFRELLDKLGSNIDAVTVSTPDHTHAVIAAMAMRMGKACFCQKPLTHSVYEARRLGEIAKEMKVATQMGNQGTAADGLRKGAAIIRAGGLGPVKEVHVWTNRPVWPQGGPRPQEKPVPDYLHWDAFLGPAPYRPFGEGPNGEGYHPFKWRGFWDFGTGALGDMACHTVNMPYMALDLRNPTSIEAQSSGHNKDTYPKWSTIRFEFPATSTRPAVTLFWYDGGKRPEPEVTEGIEKVKSSGCLVVGEKGRLYTPDDYGAAYQLLGGATEPKVEFPKSPGHFAEFVRAIKGGEPAMSNFPNYASPLTETILLGNLAVWAGKRVEWDAAALKAVNCPEVEPIIRPSYREGYTL
jgi:predicted dehydrogenase